MRKRTKKEITMTKITQQTKKKLMLLKIELEHDSASETIQFLMDEYANHQQERGERGRPTAKEN
jgi:hypothetical protein